MYFLFFEIVGYNGDNVWSVVKDIFDCFFKYIFYFCFILVICDFFGLFFLIKEMIIEVIVCCNLRI